MKPKVIVVSSMEELMETLGLNLVSTEGNVEEITDAHLIGHEIQKLQIQAIVKYSVSEEPELRLLAAIACLELLDTGCRHVVTEAVQVKLAEIHENLRHGIYADAKAKVYTQYEEMI